MPLRDASVQQRRGIPAAQGAEWSPVMNWAAPVDLAEAMSAETGPVDIALEAFASDGRWVVACPDCGGAQFACRTDLRFMCNECANVVVDGLWRPVVWPDEVATIEAVLEVRPRRNQNWLPGETPVDLGVENVDNGLPAVVELPDPPVVVEVGPPAELPPNANGVGR